MDKEVAVSRLRKALGLLCGSLGAVCLLTISAQIVFAAAGDEGGVHGGGCAPDGYTGTYWDTCYGATWRYYSIPRDTGDVYIPGTSSGTVTGGTVSGCGQHGGYYRLALEKYNAGTGASLGEQIGLLQVNKLRSPYGSGIATFRVVNGSVGYDEAKIAFQEALDHQATNGFEWQDVSWFCYDQEWNPPDPEPDPDPTPETGAGDAYFESESKATVSGLSDGPTMSTTSPRDGYSELKFSTDDETVNIDFAHTMFYINNGSYDAKDTFPTVSTNWKVTTTGANYSNSGTYSVYGKYSASSTVDTNTISVRLNPGETKTVCQTNAYSPKYISFGRIEHKKRVGRWPNYRWVHDYWEYYESGSSGSNYSKVCVEVTRPADPSGSPYSTGTMNGTLMYTGENADSIGWNISGKTYDTRRLVEWQPIIYQVNNTNPYSADNTKGERRYQGGGVCNYYNNKTNNRNCSTFPSAKDSDNKNPGATGYDESDSGKTHNVGSSHAVVVPDYVGDKYCNSFGYRYEYWYYTTESGWQPTGRSYWHIFDSVCRTIAKKPSMSTWNNSILTNGGVQTSISPRHVPANMGDLASNHVTLYGSWTEYLNVIGGTVNGLTSGAALALGSSYQDVYNNSPLTIANNTTNLGSSGVQSSTALRTRLDTYLKNQGATDPGDTIGGSGWTDRTGTSIYHRQGDLNITGNITLSAGNYDNIYQLPQIVIFVDGNVNISSNVTQIDAWIIASSSSTINTCSDFQVGVTEADAVGRSSNTCTNQLVFNGPVMAGRLALNRSFGSDPLISYRKGTFGANSDRQTPAEVFNYRADAYLWAYAQAGRYESSYTETYTRELAPRY